MTDPVVFRPIGVIRTPFERTDGMPIQATAAVGVRGRIELDEALADGLADLDGFSHLILLYHLHRITEPRLTVTPFLDDSPRGVFATRSPARPNPIGLSTVRLVGISAPRSRSRTSTWSTARRCSTSSRTCPRFDEREGVAIGWYTDRLEGLAKARADDRFR